MMKMNNTITMKITIRLYKDKNDDNGYVVEFTNVDKDRNMIVGIDDLIQFSDRYKFGEEIKLK